MKFINFRGNPDINCGIEGDNATETSAFINYKERVLKKEIEAMKKYKKIEDK